MIRTVKLGQKWYALPIEEIDEEELENILMFVEGGEPVLLTNSINEVQRILSDEELEIVEPE